MDSSKVVLITGASSGIGQTTAMRLAHEGYLVMAGVRSGQDAKRLEEQGRGSIKSVQLDITRPEDIIAAKDSLKDMLQGHRLSGIVNNAAVGGSVGPLESVQIEQVRACMEVNVFGHLQMTQAFLPIVREQAGRLIFVGSAAGRVALGFMGPYPVTKFALVALCDCLRRELKATGVPVCLIEPGMVATAILSKAEKELDETVSAMSEKMVTMYGRRMEAVKRMMGRAASRAIPPERVAFIIQKALEDKRPKPRYLVGKEPYFAMLARVLPDRFIDWISLKVLDGGITPTVMGW